MKFGNTREEEIHSILSSISFAGRGKEEHMVDKIVVVATKTSSISYYRGTNYTEIRPDKEFSKDIEAAISNYRQRLFKELNKYE